MGAPLLTIASRVMCPHGGQATLVTTNAKVRAGGDVILLDEQRIEKSDAMVRSAAGAHRVFLCEAQAGQRLARVDDRCARAANRFHGRATRAACRISAPRKASLIGLLLCQAAGPSMMRVSTPER